MQEPTDLDNSRLETYGLCPRRYHLRYNLNLAKKVEHLNTRFSTHMIHDPITEWYLRGKDWQPTPQGWASRLEQLKITPEEAAVKANAVYSVENAVRAFQFYTERFAADHDEYEFLAKETYLVDPEMGFGSKPDVRARRKSDGALYTFELKFSDWDFVLENAPINPQFLGQVNNTRGKGVVVTLVQPSGTKWSTFGAVRVVIEPTQAELEEWRRDTLHRMAQVRESYRTGVWPKQAPHACTSFGGCPFADLCVAGTPKEMLDRWPRSEDPLSYLTEGAQHAA